MNRNVFLLILIVQRYVDFLMSLFSYDKNIFCSVLSKCLVDTIAASVFFYQLIEDFRIITTRCHKKTIAPSVFSTAELAA